MGEGAILLRPLLGVVVPLSDWSEWVGFEYKGLVAGFGVGGRQRHVLSPGLEQIFPSPRVDSSSHEIWVGRPPLIGVVLVLQLLGFHDRVLASARFGQISVQSALRLRLLVIHT